MYSCLFVRFLASRSFAETRRTVLWAAGIVGMAAAYALGAQHSSSLVVLETEPRLAAHQTGNNSGVIHSGLYNRPGSLKARNCVEGRELLYRFCAEHGVAHDRCGKLVVPTRHDELPRLDELQRRGQANGLLGVRRLSAAELREHEPHVEGVAGLWVPETGIVDYVQTTETYARLAGDAGAAIRTQARVVAVDRRSDALTLETTQGEFRCRHLTGPALAVHTA